MKTDWKDYESIDIARDYAEQLIEISCNEEDISSQLRKLRDDILRGDKNASRRLHVHAKHYLALIRFILDNTTAMEQLVDIFNKAEKLLSAKNVKAA